MAEESFEISPTAESFVRMEAALTSVTFLFAASRYPVVFALVPIVYLVVGYVRVPILWRICFSTTRQAAANRWTVMSFFMYRLAVWVGLLEKQNPVPVALGLMMAFFAFFLWKSPEDHENPQLPGRNREPMHVPLASYPSEALARANDRLASPHVLMLSSETAWKFRLFPNPGAVPDFWSESAARDGFETTPVPSNWELQGFSYPIYTNVKHPVATSPPKTPRDDNPTGCYYREFDVPAPWIEAGRRVHLTFHGVASFMVVYVNGVEVGMSKDSRLPAEFDVTDVVRTTANLVAVKVLRWCDTCPYLEDQDHWFLSGIHRDIELSSKPASHIRDLHVRTELDPGLNEATVVVDVLLNAEADPGASFAFRLLDGDRVVAEEAAVGSSGRAARASLLVVDPALWSAEAPHLYTLTVGYLDRGGAPIEFEGCRVGIRSVAVEQGLLKVNGRSVLIKGVNRHDHDERTGKVVTVASMRADLVLMKQLNFNAVRTSHYPNDWRLYDLCDELGLYVCDEANIEAHGDSVFWATNLWPLSRLAADPGYRPAFVSRVARMVQRDRNHPSIIMWSLGNEAGAGANLQACRQWIQEHDPTRPVQYEGEGSPQELSDVFCPMYMDVEGIKRMAQVQPARPVILCEYAHAMGNSCGSLHEYWEAFRSNSRLQGGFIWDWKDQGLLRKGRDGLGEGYAYGGDYGEPVHDGNFNINGLIFPNNVPHPSAYEAKACQQPVQFRCSEAAATHVVVDVMNENLFVDLGYLEFSWEVVVDGDTVADGLKVPLSPATVRPYDKARVTLLYDAAARAAIDRALFGAWVNVRAALASDQPWAPRGHVVAEAQIPVGGPAEPTASAEAAPVPAPVATPRADAPGEVLRASAAGTSASLDGALGVLQQLECDGSPLVRAFELCFYRAPTDNDLCGGKVPLDMVSKVRQIMPGALMYPMAIIEFIRTRSFALPQNEYAWLWRRAGLDRMRPAKGLVELVRGAPDGPLAVRAGLSYAANGEEDTPIDATLHTEVLGDGTVKIDVEVRLDAALPVLPRVGVVFKVPVELDRVEFLGRGPHENYADRLMASSMGRWRSTVDDRHVRYLYPSENGGAEEVKYVSLAADDGHGLVVVPRSYLGPAVGEETVHMSVSRYSVGELEHADHQEELVSGDPSSIYLHVDHRHMGVAGENSWIPNVHEPYLIHPGTFRFGLTLAPLREGEAPGAVAARIVAAGIAGAKPETEAPAAPTAA